MRFHTVSRNEYKIQLEIGTTYDEKKAKELVQNLGEGVKTTGVIYGLR